MDSSKADKGAPSVELPPRPEAFEEDGVGSWVMSATEANAWMDAAEAEIARLREERDERNKRMHGRFGFVKGEDGKCACAYCVGDVEALADHAAEMEMQLYLPGGYQERYLAAEAELSQLKAEMESMRASAFVSLEPPQLMKPDQVPAHPEGEEKGE